jgi:Ser/Thr protein kinase RdoA (MazF antagonist)
MVYNIHHPSIPAPGNQQPVYQIRRHFYSWSIFSWLCSIMSDSCVLPEFDIREAAAFAADLFAVSGPIKKLDGERDLNFLIGEAGERHVFKIANAQESPAMLECQHQVFQRLAEAQVFPSVATARESINGKLIETVHSRAGEAHACRLLPFIEGRMLVEVETLEPALLEDIGRRLAMLDLALGSFSHPALERPLLWKMDNALEVLESFKPLLAGDERAGLVGHFESAYRARAVPRFGELRRAVIHNDANRANLLVDERGERVVSVIDFGDMVSSWLVVEPVIAATYVMLEQAEPLAMAAGVIRGYHAGLPLQPAETGLIFDFICMRLCMSVCINAHQMALEPDNEYLNIDVEPAWELLEYLRGIEPAEAIAALAPE